MTDAVRSSNVGKDAEGLSAKRDLAAQVTPNQRGQSNQSASE
jgi:hypothetical protein